MDVERTAFEGLVDAIKKTPASVPPDWLLRSEGLRADSSTVSEGMSWCLVDVKGGRCFVLQRDEVVIGRDAQCDVQILTSGVSRRHASVGGLRNFRPMVIDHKSKNGTFVNGEPVVGQVALNDKDELGIGNVSRFVLKHRPVTNDYVGLVNQLDQHIRAHDHSRAGEMFTLLAGFRFVGGHPPEEYATAQYLLAKFMEATGTLDQQRTALLEVASNPLCPPVTRLKARAKLALLAIRGHYAANIESELAHVGSEAQALDRDGYLLAYAACLAGMVKTVSRQLEENEAFADFAEGLSRLDRSAKTPPRFEDYTVARAGHPTKPEQIQRGRQTLRARILVERARAHLEVHDYGKFREDIEAAHELLESRYADSVVLGDALALEGTACYRAQEFDRASHLFERAAEIYHRSGVPQGEYKIRRSNGLILLAKGHVQAAVKVMNDARKQFETIGDRIEIAALHGYLGNSHLVLGNTKRADQHFRAEQALLEDVPVIGQKALAFAHRNLGRLFRHERRHAAASHQFEKAVKLLRDVPHEELALALTLLEFGNCLVYEQRHEEAEPVADEAARLLSANERSQDLRLVDALRGMIAAAAGRAIDADTFFQRALQSSVPRSRRLRYRHIELRLEYARMLVLRRDNHHAKHALLEAFKDARDLQAKPLEKAIVEEMESISRDLADRARRGLVADNDSITKSADHDDWEEVDCSIAFIDLRGYTMHATQVPLNELRETLNNFYQIGSKTAANHGGQVNKFIGDAVLMVFDRPRTHPWDAVLAVAQAICEVDLLRRTGTWKLSVTAGIHTGRVARGNIGSGQRVDYTVVGDVVNVAARLQSLAGSETVGEREIMLVTEEACLAAKNAGGSLRTRGKVRSSNVKNRAKAVRYLSLDPSSIVQDGGHEDQQRPLSPPTRRMAADETTEDEVIQSGE